MLYMYDAALKNKFETVLQQSGINVVYSPVDTFFERVHLKTDNASVSLPAISLWRTGQEFNPYTAGNSLRVPNVGRNNYENYTRLEIFSMQISLSYNLEIWAASDMDRDSLLQEILYFITLYPNISIDYQGETFKFPVLIGTPEDTTDIVSFENTGDLYRMTIPLQIPDARFLFFENTTKLAKYINLDFYSKDQQDMAIQISPKGVFDFNINTE